MPYGELKAVGSNRCWRKTLLRVTRDKIQPAVKISAAAAMVTCWLWDRDRTTHPPCLVPSL